MPGSHDVCCSDREGFQGDQEFPRSSIMNGGIVPAVTGQKLPFLHVESLCHLLCAGERPYIVVNT